MITRRSVWSSIAWRSLITNVRGVSCRSRAFWWPHSWVRAQPAVYMMGHTCTHMSHMSHMCVLGRGDMVPHTPDTPHIHTVCMSHNPRPTNGHIQGKQQTRLRMESAAWVDACMHACKPCGKPHEPCPGSVRTATNSVRGATNHVRECSNCYEQCSWATNSVRGGHELCSWSHEQCSWATNSVRGGHELPWVRRSRGSRQVPHEKFHAELDDLRVRETQTSICMCVFRGRR